MRRAMIVAVLALVAVAAIGGMSACGLQKQVEESTTGQIDQAKNAAAKSNILTIKTGILSVAATSGQLPATATPESLGGYLNPWPTNPWTNQPMQAGDGVGDFVYKPGAGVSFTLAVHLDGGSLYQAP